MLQSRKLSVADAVHVVADNLSEMLQSAKLTTFEQLCEFYHWTADDVRDIVNTALAGTGWVSANRGLILTNREESIGFKKFVSKVSEELAK